MSHDYSCWFVPFDVDGDTNQFYLPDAEPRGPSPPHKMVDGVAMIAGGPSMNAAFTHRFNEITDGHWQAFLTGGPLKWDSNCRFVVLDKRRRELIPQLKAFIPRLVGTVLHDPFNQLFERMEFVLHAHEDRMVALVIH